jgi:hypothetical protein
VVYRRRRRKLVDDMTHMYILPAPLIESHRQSNMHLVLPHLYDVVAGYVESYRKLVAQGDFLLQDNSIFELKHVVPGDLIDFAQMISASQVMVPEVLRDTNGSMDAASVFFTDRRVKAWGGSLAACVQGKSYTDIASHYRWLCNEGRVKTISIPFNFEFDAVGDVSESKKQHGWNRFSLINRLVQEGVWRCDKSHHLLGLYNPAELAMYRLFPVETQRSIRSNDSSSCFWHSLYGVRYDMQIGLPYKKIETHVDFETEFEYDCQEIAFNLNVVQMQAFAQGIGGSELLKWYRAYAEREGIRMPDEAIQ